MAMSAQNIAYYTPMMKKKLEECRDNLAKVTTDM